MSTYLVFQEVLGKSFDKQIFAFSKNTVPITHIFCIANLHDWIVSRSCQPNIFVII